MTYRGKSKLIVTLALAGTLATALSACNTVKGLGRDVESVGRAGEKAID